MLTFLSLFFSAAYICSQLQLCSSYQLWGKLKRQCRVNSSTFSLIATLSADTHLKQGKYIRGGYYKGLLQKVWQTEKIFFPKTEHIALLLYDLFNHL